MVEQNSVPVVEDIEPFYCDWDTTSLKGSTLILPTVSTGNVPQLTVDLLINSLGKGNAPLKRLGVLGSSYVLNYVGNDAFGVSNQLALPMEVYQCNPLNLTVMQLRSPIIAGYGKEFTCALLQWISNTGISRIIALTSADASYRPDTLLEGAFSVRFLPICGNGFGNSLGVKPLESSLKESHLIGSSILSNIVDLCPTYLRENQETAALIMFCMEGDNTADSYAMWKLLRNAIPIPESPRLPSSWKLLFGPKLETDVLQAMF